MNVHCTVDRMPAVVSRTKFSLLLSILCSPENAGGAGNGGEGEEGERRAGEGERRVKQ